MDNQPTSAHKPRNTGLSKIDMVERLQVICDDWSDDRLGSVAAMNKVVGVLIADRRKLRGMVD